MIITRTPLRISFFGGGTDFPEYYAENGGAVLAASVNRYCYINASQFPSSLFDYSIRVSYSRGELVKSPKDIEHPVFRACLESVGISSDIELHAILDMPAFTGLGSSSAFTVSLLHALHAFRGDRVTASTLASEAIHIEREVLGECVGVQDQLMAAHGGFCFIEFAGREMPRVSHVRIGLENLLFLQSHMLLVFTNIKRRAQEIEKTKLQAMRNRAPALRQIHECCREALGIFEAPGPLDIAAIGGLLDESWQRKKSLSESVSNESIDRLYELGKRHGAYGGKILGAGGGGFLLLLAPPERHDELKKAFTGFHTLDVEIGVPGSEVIFNAAAARSHSIPFKL
jgi:D-glycero-alpha-D-manno-heptose-7-phosphate kinase